MKKVISFVLAALMLVLCSCSSNADVDKPIGGRDADPDLDPTQSRLLLEELSVYEEKGREADEAFSNAINKSAFDYFSKAVEDKKADNILISPLSIYIALAMTACGANGDTLSQMQDVLGELPIEEAARYIYALSEDLKDNERISLGLANSIWVRDNKGMIEVNEDFLGVTKKYFSADVFKAKFDKSTLGDINTWIEENTNGMIKEMLDEIPEDAVMYLINALVFEAEWRDTYDRAQLHEAEFTSYGGERMTTELMFSDEDYYLKDDNAKGFIKPYADSRYAFAALLPDEGVDVYEYASSLTGKDFSDILKAKEKAMVDAAMPQFSYEYADSLAEELKALGMTDAFSSALADLSGLGTSPMGNIYISDVMHKTFIEVSPKGTKAGAATVVEAVCESAAEIIDLNRYQVYLDRPFVYSIVDLENGIPLFIGVLAELE